MKPQKIRRKIIARIAYRLCWWYWSCALSRLGSSVSSWWSASSWWSIAIRRSCQSAMGWWALLSWSRWNWLSPSRDKLLQYFPVRFVFQAQKVSHDGSSCFFWWWKAFLIKFLDLLAGVIVPKEIAQCTVDGICLWLPRNLLVCFDTIVYLQISAEGTQVSRIVKLQCNRDVCAGKFLDGSAIIRWSRWSTLASFIMPCVIVVL